jgi:hypothetical protein
MTNIFYIIMLITLLAAFLLGIYQLCEYLEARDKRRGIK